MWRTVTTSGGLCAHWTRTGAGHPPISAGYLTPRVVSGPEDSGAGEGAACGQRHKHTQGQPQAASDCFSPKKDGNTADHSHHCSGHRRTPLLERKEHRHSIAFSTSFTPITPGGSTHGQRQAAKYNEAGEGTSSSRQGHVRPTLRRHTDTGIPSLSGLSRLPHGRAPRKGAGTSMAMLATPGNLLLPVQLDVGHQTQPSRCRRPSREQIVLRRFSAVRPHLMPARRCRSPT